MEFEPQDRKVVELLTNLKGATDGYPSDMLAARRQSFLKNMAAGASLSMGTGAARNQALKGGGGSGAAPITMGRFLEVALLVAIVAEAGALAYFYRDKVADVFRNIRAPSQVQEIVSPPVSTFPFPELEISEIPSPAILTGTASETAISTQVPGVADNPTSNNNGSAPSTEIAASTPAPGVNNENNGTNGNNGNHYGQTPKPERTKDNKDNQPPNDNPGNGNNDKPPKEEKDKNQ